MDREPLPVAMIGVGGFGGHTLAALRRSGLVRLVGVADEDAAVAERAGRENGVAFYDDNRRMLAETRPQAAYVAVPPAEAPELIALCADHGVHVWKELPLARGLDEAVVMVRRMEQAKLKLAVGTQRRFARGYRRAREMLAELGQVFLARSHYLFNWGAELGWRSDRAAAGGGALLELGYHPIDLLIWLLGLPDAAYGTSVCGGRTASPGGKGGLKAYDTDDTAAAILRFAGGAMATVAASRASGPVSEELSVYGPNGSLTANGETCRLRDPDGNVLDQVADDSPPAAVFQRQAEAFALAVAGGDKHYECSGLENLLNLATIEAIYLSDRTSQPEHPPRLLKTHGLTAEDCLRYRPVEP